MPRPVSPWLENAVVLLFAAGKRPAVAEIEALSRSQGQFAVTLECSDASEPDQWAELLANGLTFDVTGLSPGRACRPPENTDQLFGYTSEFHPSACEGIMLTPGPHLVSGGPMVPVLRCLSWLAAELSDLPHLKGIAWQSAGTVCEPAYFREAVTRWLGGGPFPGLGLTSLESQADGSLRSKGLSLFTGQELVLDPELSVDKSQGAEVALRLLHWLVESGRVEETTSLTGPSGDSLFLEPNPEAGTVSVWRGSR